MKLSKMLGIVFAISSCIASAEIIEIENNIPFRQTYNLAEATIFKVETSNGEIELLPAEDGLFTIEASASGFQKHAKVDVVGPIDGKYKFELMKAKANGNGNVSIGNVYVGGGIVFGGSSSINGVRINGPYSGMSVSGFSSPQLNITLHVPPEFLSHVQLKSSNGKIVAHGFPEPMAGRQVKIVTSNASVEIGDFATSDDGEISVSTSNGSIDADGCNGNLVLDTSNGKVTASGNYGGNIRVRTSNGKVSVTGHSGGSVSAKTSNGNIEFNNPDATSEDGNTSNGKVHYTKRAVAPSTKKSSAQSSAQVFNF